MKARFGITGKLILLLVVLVIVSQGSAYFATSEQLRDAVHEREAEKIRTLGSTITAQIEQGSAQAITFAKLLSSNENIAAAVMRAESRGPAETAAILDKMFAGSKLDLLEVTDRHEAVIHRAHGKARLEDRSLIWGVSEAMAGAGSVATTIEPDRIAIRAVEPLQLDGKVTGTLMAGSFIGEKFIAELGKQTGTRLALLARTKPLAASAPELLGSLDADAIRDAFEQKIPVYRENQARRVTRVYLPVLVVDEGFVVLAEIDSSTAYQRIEAGTRRVILIASAILVASILLGVLLITRALRPLRDLRARAEHTMRQISGIPAGEQMVGDEITSVVKVLDQLTDILLARNRDLSDAKAAAESASEAKSQFLSNMSHEIRTPLNGVLGMAELLNGTRLDEDQRKYCRAIAASGRTLHDLLSDILDLAKIEARKVRLESINFSPASLVTDIGDAYRELAANRSSVLMVQIDPAIPAQLAGDPTRLRQVLSNLTGNAVKFTENGNVTLTVQCLDEAAADGRARLRFSVIDTGIGMTEDMVKKLFQPFVQADSTTTRNYGGTGLGLVICKHLVELMGGTVRLESRLGKGTTLSFDLPLDAATASADTEVANVLLEKYPVRVLVAEDTAVNKEVIRAMLTRLGASVTIVDNGQLAVEAAREDKFDIIFMDCQMPVMNGYQATAHIREEHMRASRARIPIVALTANALAEDRQQCLDAGMDDYIAKPVSVKNLKTALARWTRPVAAENA